MENKLIVSETERLIIREFISEDANALSEFASKEYVTRWLPDWIGCEEWALPWIDGKVKNGYKIDNPMVNFLAYAVILKENNRLIGQVGCGDFEEKELGICYFIDEDYANQGFITEAMTAFITYLFDKYNSEYLITTIQPNNYSSIATAMKLGFQYINTINILDNGQNEILPFHYYRLYQSK